MGRIRKLPGNLGPAGLVLVPLRELFLQAGEPSMRDLETMTCIGHDTVHRILTGSKLPNWGKLELIVEALGGDRAYFHERWVSARRDMEGDGG